MVRFYRSTFVHAILILRPTYTWASIAIYWESYKILENARFPMNFHRHIYSISPCSIKTKKITSNIPYSICSTGAQHKFRWEKSVSAIGSEILPNTCATLTLESIFSKSFANSGGFRRCQTNHQFSMLSCIGDVTYISLAFSVWHKQKKSCKTSVIVCRVREMR